jgi:OHCU decarboxylase
MLSRMPLRPDAEHAYGNERMQRVIATHLRLNMYPDGGISRLRVFGSLTRAARETVLLRFLNTSDTPALGRTLQDFCGAHAWIVRMTAARPYASASALLHAADAASSALTPEDVRAAFLHHAPIGERQSVRPQSATAESWAAREQSGTSRASSAERDALAQANRAYEERFGHVFIVRAAGRSTAEILENLRSRMANDPRTEVHVAAEELKQITRLRIDRLLE